MALEEYRYDVEMCLRCSSCKWIDPMWTKSKRYNKICPISSHYHFDGYSCQGLMDISLAILEGELEYTPQLAEIVFHCTLCGACDVMCKRTLETERLLVIEELRKELAQRNILPQKGLERLRAALERSHNALGAPHEKRFEWLHETRRAALKNGAKAAYFVGCTSSYKHPEIAQATVDLLRAGGVDFTLLESSEWCCGNPLLRAGFSREARRVMDHNLKAIRDQGVDTIITSCAECYHMWKVDYPRLHDQKTLGYRVLHMTEVLADLLKENTLRFTTPVSLTATYHDSCRLGRLSEPWEPWSGKRLQYGRPDPPKTFRRGSDGVYFAPRQVLKLIPGLTFVEMERVRENTFCCGAGGAVKWVFNDFAVKTGSRRLNEALDSGAEVLISSCPFCKWNFEDAATLKQSPLRILDITEIAAQAL